MVKSDFKKDEKKFLEKNNQVGWWSLLNVFHTILKFFIFVPLDANISKTIENKVIYTAPILMKKILMDMFWS